MAERRSADITNNAGGVMTDEVGVITGDLTLVTELTGAPPASGTTPPAATPPAATTSAAQPAAASAPVTGRLTPTTTPFLHPGAPAGTAPMSAAAAAQPSGAASGATRGTNGRNAGPATAVLRVQYKGAAEWYTVTNSTCQLPDAASLDAVHQLAVGLLNRPEG